MRKLLALCCLLIAPHIFAKQEIITLPTRADTGEAKISVSYLLDAEAKTPQAILLIPGRGNGDIHLTDIRLPTIYSRDSFVFMRDASIFKNADLALAFLDNPSDHKKSISLSFRTGVAHRQDITNAFNDLIVRFPGVKVYLAGTDIGAVSVLNAAQGLGNRIGGVILAGGDYIDLRTFDYSGISAPVLMLHHAADECDWAPIIEARLAAERYKFNFVSLTAGEVDTDDNKCGSRTKHGFYGNEREFASVVSEWISGHKNFPADGNKIQTLLNEQLIAIPMTTSAGETQLEATVFKPDGKGPFPLLIINHGIPADKDEVRQRKIRYRHVAESHEFVKLGFAVAIPMRRGYGYSGGTFPPASCNIANHGLEDAKEIMATIEYMTKQSYVDGNNVVLLGQSGGGLASMAFGTLNYPGVKAILNFAGGLRLFGNAVQESCWENQMTQAFGLYGGKTSVPSLWFYTANDSLFSPSLAKRSYEAYQKAGGKGKLLTLPAFKQDGHTLFGDTAGIRIWLPEVEHFLTQIGFGKKYTLTQNNL